MAQRADFDKIELSSHPGLAHLDHRTQRLARRPADCRARSRPVSAQLKRLRELTGDPLLVRAGNGMAPTETALQLVGPAANAAARGRAAVRPARARSAASMPSTSAATFRIAASDYLDPLFLPELVAQLKRLAPQVRLELHAAVGRVRLPAQPRRRRGRPGIGNWLEPPGELHLGRLMSDEVVCLVADDHPACARRARLDGRELPRLRARRADAAAPRRARRHRRAPGRAGPGARHRRCAARTSA